MVSSFTDSRRISPRSIHNEKLIGSNGITELIYFSQANFDAAPAAQEVFINAVRDQRLYIPTDCMVCGTLMFTAWNQTAGTAAAAIARVIDFVALNDNDVVSFDPAATVRVTKGVGVTVDLGLEQTDRSIRLNFTGAASSNYLVRSVMRLIATGRDANEFSNYFTNLT